MKKSILDYMTEMLELSMEDALECFNEYLSVLDSYCTEIEQGIAARELDKIRSATHALIGCSGNIGADEIAALSKQINLASKAGNYEEASTVFKTLSERCTELQNA